MKRVLASLAVVLLVSGCTNPFEDVKEVKKEVKVVKKTIIDFTGMSVKDLEVLALSHGGHEKLQKRIKRRIYLLNYQEAELKRVRKEIELGGLKSEFKRLKLLRDRYPVGSAGRELLNKTIRSIRKEIQKFYKENRVVKSVNRKPASYVKHPGKRMIVVFKLKRDIKILIMQHNQATGVFKARLAEDIKSLQRTLDVVIGKVEECK